MRHVVLVVVLGLLAGCSVGAAGPEPGAGPPWLEGRVTALEAADRVGAADLAVFDRVIGDAPLVLLGEATHGTHEFFALKSDLIKRMVERGELDTVLLEDSVASVAPLSRWVAGGDGDPAVLMGDLYQIWNAEEVLELATWLREHNARSDRQVRFVGFDVTQGLPSSAVELVTGWLDGQDPDLAAQVRGLLACIDLGENADRYADLPPDIRDACRIDVGAARDAVAASESELRPGDPLEYDMARLAVEGLVADEIALALPGDDVNARISARDVGMADILATAVELGGTRAAAWAHNAHVGYFADFAALGVELERSAGWLLRERLGADVRSVGFSFDTGTFHAVDTSRGAIVPVNAGAGSREGHEARLRSLPAPASLIDPAGVAELAEIRPLRTAVGGGFSPGDEVEVEVSVAASFDLLVHVPSTTPSRLLTEDVVFAPETVGELRFGELGGVGVLSACRAGDAVDIDTVAGRGSLSGIDGPAPLLTLGDPADGGIVSQQSTVEIGGSVRAVGTVLFPGDEDAVPFELDIPNLERACEAAA